MDAREVDIDRIMYEQNCSRATAEYVHDTRVAFEKRHAAWHIQPPRIEEETDRRS